MVKKGNFFKVVTEVLSGKKGQEEAQNACV